MGPWGPWWSKGCRGASAGFPGGCVIGGEDDGEGLFYIGPWHSGYLVWSLECCVAVVQDVVGPHLEHCVQSWSQGCHWAGGRVQRR